MSDLIQKQLVKMFVDPQIEKLKKINTNGNEIPDVEEGKQHVDVIVDACGDAFEGANIPQIILGANEVSNGVKRIAANVDVAKIQAGLAAASDHVVALAKLAYGVFLAYAPKK